MADHYIALNRGVEGFKLSDFTTGTSSAAGNSIELRIADAAGLTKKDAVLALAAFQRFIETAPWLAPTGIAVAL